MIDRVLSRFVRTGRGVSVISTMNEVMAVGPALDRPADEHPSGPAYESPDSADFSRPRPAVLDGRYVLGESLGQGGMARVYRAVDTLLDRTVAVKVFNQHSALPDGDVRRAAEVRLLAGMNHPCLVMVYDAGRDDSNVSDPFSYLVMELVDGTTLAKATSQGPLPPPAVAAIGAQLAAALDHVHSRGVVHRDVKPANVLLAQDPEGTVAKLADFGVARLLDSTRLTGCGTTLGTPNYLSPEQATGEVVTPASDIYSLGLVLLEALTGERAYPGIGVEAVVQRLHRQPRIPDRLGPGWTTLLTGMTASEPAARPDAHTVEEALRALADPSRKSAPIAVAPSGAARARVRAAALRHRWAWPAGAVGSAVVASAVILAAQLGGGRTQATATRAVPGKLGADIGLLEAVAPRELHADLLALSRAAANGNRSLARTDVAAIADDLRALHRRGQVSDVVYREVLAALAALSADLRPAVHSVPTAPVASMQPANATRPARPRVTRTKPRHARTSAPVRRPAPAQPAARPAALPAAHAAPPPPRDNRARWHHGGPGPAGHDTRHGPGDWRTYRTESRHRDRHGDAHSHGHHRWHGDGHGHDGDPGDTGRAVR
jgi:eukaryotic-like serine/threonine-protein kinase